MNPAEDGYDGPAELIGADGAAVAVRVRLRGRFDPISGHYHWYGRVAAGDAVSALLAGLATERDPAVTLRTPHGQVRTRLRDLDPWGRPRVDGFGAAPFAVTATLPDDTA